VDEVSRVRFYLIYRRSSSGSMIIDIFGVGYTRICNELCFTVVEFVKHISWKFTNDFRACLGGLTQCKLCFSKSVACVMCGSNPGLAAE